ncbi:F0F1 ATP synthase subunit gamma [Candidatus Microgenomates bacterium]|nr:F0F1 ATP synthase subunit gamma [Candidatus Microgenomates bacterium]
MEQKQIKQTITTLQTLDAVARAYTEISSSRMKKTRGLVLSSREFLAALDEIFREVRTSYRRQVLSIAKKTGRKQLTFLAHNGKTVAVFISANTGLYGDLIQRTFATFLEELKQPEIEVTVVGRLGLSLFLEKEPRRPYTYFDFPDYGVDTERMAAVVAHLVPYEEIHAYYGRFQSVMRQVPALFNISAETQSLVGGQERSEVVKYLFEPTLEDILMFFETEMFASLLEQVMREGQLAKFAARMRAMDEATQNIKKSLTRAQLLRLRIWHAAANRKQLNALPALLRWGGENGRK